MRPSKWYPEVRRPTVLPDITMVRSSIDNRNPGYQPSHRWGEMVSDVVSIKDNQKEGETVSGIERNLASYLPYYANTGKGSLCKSQFLPLPNSPWNDFSFLSIL